MTAEHIQIWARVVRGLEWIAAAEVQLLPETSTVEVGHRDLLFGCGTLSRALQLRCVDDVFAVWGELDGLDNTRASLSRLTSNIRRLPDVPIDIEPSARHLRLTVSFLGRRNYSRYEVEEIAGPILASRLGLSYLDSRQVAVPDTVWCRLHIVGPNARIGLRTTPQPLHRRAWRTEGLAGALHPPIAAAMARLADLHEGHVVVDPFAGTGTTLIEAGLVCPGLTLVGCDISGEAVYRGCEQARRASVSLDLLVADANMTRLPTADRVISNPPWGRQVSVQGKLTNQDLVNTLFRNLERCGRCVVLGDQASHLAKLIHRTELDLLLVQTVRVAGRLAQLIVAGHRQPRFPETRWGQALSEAWKKYHDT